MYCGIDLHSNNSYLAILNGELEDVACRRVRNDLKQILAFLEPYRADVSCLGVESTYNWYWLVDGLREARYDVRLVNTTKTSRFSDMKYTDDKHDARWIAKMLALGILPEGYAATPEERRVRDLLRRRGYLVHKRTSFLQSIGMHLERETGRKYASEALKRWTGDDIRKVIQDPVVAENISSMLPLVRLLGRQIKDVESTVLGLSKVKDEFRLLMTTPGIGKIIALTVMHETIDIRRFPTANDYVSYCRCAKSEHTSNHKRKGSGNRKNGNKYLSWAFSEAAHHCRLHEPLADRYYQRKKSRSHPQVAKRALAAKIARGCFYVLRDQVQFDPSRIFE